MIRMPRDRRSFLGFVWTSVIMYGPKLVGNAYPQKPSRGEPSPTAAWIEVPDSCVVTLSVNSTPVAHEIMWSLARSNE